MTAAPQIAHRLAAHSPAETNSLVASSVRQYGVTLEEVIEAKFSYQRPDGSVVPARHVKTWAARADSLDQLAVARDKLAFAMQPADRGQIIGWLAELSVITARRPDDDATEDLRAAAYSSRLIDYPADVAREALLIRRWKFFPTWQELAEACDEIVKPRRLMQAALDRAAAEVAERERRSRALPDQGAAVPTPDERAARRAESARSMADVIASLKDAAAREAEEAAAQEAATKARYAPHAEASE